MKLRVDFLAGLCLIAAAGCGRDGGAPEGTALTAKDLGTNKEQKISITSRKPQS